MTDFTLNDQLKLATLLTQVFTERAKLKISEMCHICVCVCICDCSITLGTPFRKQILLLFWKNNVPSLQNLVLGISQK